MAEHSQMSSQVGGPASCEATLPRKEAVQTSLQTQICHWCQLLMCHRSCRSSSRGGSILMSMMLAASLRKLILILSAIWEISPLNYKPLKHWSKPEPRHPSATRGFKQQWSKDIMPEASLNNSFGPMAMHKCWMWPWGLFNLRPFINYLITLKLNDFVFLSKPVAPSPASSQWPSCRDSATWKKLQIFTLRHLTNAVLEMDER